jgi:hypothetical protein
MIPGVRHRKPNDKNYLSKYEEALLVPKRQQTRSQVSLSPNKDKSAQNRASSESHVELPYINSRQTRPDDEADANWRKWKQRKDEELREKKHPDEGEAQEAARKIAKQDAASTF